MKIFAVINTNILVSALLTSKKDSATVQVVEKILQKKIIPLYSEEIFDEYRNVLHRKKFKFSTEIVDYMLNAISNFGVLVTPSEVEIILPDMKDLQFYKIVAENTESYLVTGNLKHFPRSDRIITAHKMIDLIKNLNF